ncbi:MAG TPA: transglutaminase domain-containing protein [Clostridiaceae bacterium]|nr:transglutaminase domain-containing protein [Clostridiaceae bacterium]
MRNKFASIDIAPNIADFENEKLNINKFKIIIDTIFYTGIAYLFSLIWFKLLINSVWLDYPYHYAWFPKLIVILFFLLLVKYPKIAGLSTLGILALTSVLGVFFSKSIGQPFFDFIRTHALGIIDSIKWGLALDPTIEVMPEYFPVYVALLSIIVGMLFIYVKPAPINLLIVWIVPIIVIVHINQQDISLPAFFIGLLCIIITFARQSIFGFSWRKVWQIPPLALITIILALIFSLQSVLPQDTFRNEKLSDQLNQLIKSSKKMPDTVHYFEFSIRDAGYYPQDVRLGGPVELKNIPFMNVKGPGSPFYLRGTVFNQFEQNIWRASSMSTNYLFYNEDPIDQQAEAFGYPDHSNLPLGVIENYFTDTPLTISPIYQPIQAIFHGGKPLEIINLANENTDNIDDNLSSAGDISEIMYYFNPDGQIYASLQIPNPGYLVNGYVSRLGSTANYLNLIENDANVGNLIFSNQTIANYKSYRSFLEAIEPNLANIIYQDITDQNVKANQLISIINYLKNNFSYNLKVEEVPANQDFFEHFISTKKGYCTYFATALAVLTREAGFESRYVEGFLIKGIKDHNLPKDQYERVISTDQAHAWTEIKIEGLGWVPFDATPTAALENIQTDQEKEQELTALLPEPSETEPTQTEPTQPLVTETPNIQTEPNKPDLSPEEQHRNLIGKTLLMIILILLLIAGLLLYLIWRKRVYKRRHNPNWLSNRFDGDLKKSVLYIWEDLKYLYKLNGGSYESHNTILTIFATMLKTFDWNNQDTYSAYQAIEQVLYAEREPSSVNYDNLLNIYNQSELFTAQTIPKLKWFIKRFLCSPEPKL